MLMQATCWPIGRNSGKYIPKIGRWQYMHLSSSFAKAYWSRLALREHLCEGLHIVEVWCDRQ